MGFQVNIKNFGKLALVHLNAFVLVMAIAGIEHVTHVIKILYFGEERKEFK